MPFNSASSYKWTRRVQKCAGRRESNNQLGVVYAVRFFIFIFLFRPYRSGFLSMLKVSTFSLWRGFGEEDSTLQNRLEEFFNEYGPVYGKSNISSDMCCSYEER